MILDFEKTDSDIFLLQKSDSKEKTDYFTGICDKKMEQKDISERNEIKDNITINENGQNEQIKFNDIIGKLGVQLKKVDKK